MSGIAVVGSIVHDLNKRIERFPERNGLVRCTSFESSMGGLTGNVARDLAALDPALTVYAIGTVGTDAAGDEMLGLFGIYPNIELSNIRRRGITSFTDVLAEDSDKVRSFVYYAGANEYTDGSIFPYGIDADIVHTGYILALDALDAEDEEYGTRMARFLHDLKTAGYRTSVDVVSEASDRYVTKVRPCLGWLDFAFMNEIECSRTVGLDLRKADGRPDTANICRAFDMLRGFGLKGTAIVHMPEGAWAEDCSSGARAAVEGANLPEGFIAGTVGAGDALASGFLLGAHRGLDLRDSLEYGVAAATASLRSEKPSEAVPTAEEALALLRTLREQAV